MSPIRILVVGDRMLDRYLMGVCERVSPEAPVPVVEITHERESLGAAANVAENVRALGAEVIELYSQGSPEIVKVRVIAGNHHVVRLDYDRPQEPIDPFVFSGKLTGVDAVIFSDYCKGSLSHPRPLLARLSGQSCWVLVDTKVQDPAIWAGVDVLKPNLATMRCWIGRWSSEGELERKVQALRSSLDISAIVLTRASEGMTIFDSSGRTHIDALAQEVFDVTGAGDTVIASLAVFLCEGFSLEQSARFAARAAACTCRHLGTYAPRREEVLS